MHFWGQTAISNVSYNSSIHDFCYILKTQEGFIAYTCMTRTLRVQLCLCGLRCIAFIFVEQLSTANGCLLFLYTLYSLVLLHGPTNFVLIIIRLVQILVSANHCSCRTVLVITNNTHLQYTQILQINIYYKVSLLPWPEVCIIYTIFCKPELKCFENYCHHRPRCFQRPL